MFHFWKRFIRIFCRRFVPNTRKPTSTTTVIKYYVPTSKNVYYLLFRQSTGNKTKTKIKNITVSTDYWWPGDRTSLSPELGERIFIVAGTELYGTSVGVRRIRRTKSVPASRAFTANAGSESSPMSATPPHRRRRSWRHDRTRPTFNPLPPYTP